jgi:hypothetical protein
MQNAKKKDLDFPLLIALLLMLMGFCIIFIPFGILDGIRIGSFQIEIAKYSDLGEFIGGITVPFFSGSAFILLYKTYTTQRTELHANREFIFKQILHIDKQQFEAVYFKMINMHQLITHDVSFKFQGELVKGKSCFIVFNNIIDDSNYGPSKFNELHILYNEPFEVYINFFFNILNYLNNSKSLIPDETDFYLDVFIASLNKSEVKLVWYYGQTIIIKNEKNKAFFELEIINKLDNILNKKQI